MGCLSWSPGYSVMIFWVRGVLEDVKKGFKVARPKFNSFALVFGLIGPSRHGRSPWLLI